jgi:hypothetical protein
VVDDRNICQFAMGRVRIVAEGQTIEVGGGSSYCY